jgi:hypothetical protein
VERIKGHPLFQDIEKALPLKITNKAESGVQAPFNAAACQHALNTSTQSYTCGVNLFSQSIRCQIFRSHAHAFAKSNPGANLDVLVQYRFPALSFSILEIDPAEARYRFFSGTKSILDIKSSFANV